MFKPTTWNQWRKSQQQKLSQQQSREERGRAVAINDMRIEQIKDAIDYIFFYQ